MPRPKKFDPDTAVSQIRDAFWLNGYEATSLSDLVEATGIQKASLYATFGNKREIFCKALADYDQSSVQACATMMAETQGRGALEALLLLPVEAVASGDRRGCLLCNTSSEDASIDEEASEIVARGREVLIEAIKTALSECGASHIHAGELLAQYFGMQVLARGGMEETDLRKIALSAIARI